MEYNLFIILGLLTILLTSCASFDLPYICTDGREVYDSSDCKYGVLGGGGKLDLFDEQEGCDYNLPLCSKGYVCVNNNCVEQKGCNYNNPSCLEGEECVNNMCVKSFKGCVYNNPSCSENYTCTNNECIKKEGCAYDNPPCNFNSDCINNSCVRKSNSNEDILKINEDVIPYYGIYCDKINPYDLSVRKVSADAIRDNPGIYTYTQLFDIYDWVKENIMYQTVPLEGIPYYPAETLITESGDCKNQAVLIASMVKAIGGNSKVVIDVDCVHAYAIVYFGSVDTDLNDFYNAVQSHYGKSININYITYNDEIWVIFDPAGAYYPGETLEECSGDRELYFVNSCMDCSNKYGNTPYTFEGLCYNKCPDGTVTANNYACESCEENYYVCDNKCLRCPSGNYLNQDDCMCYNKCPYGTITKDGHTCEPCPVGYESCNNECWKCPSGSYLNQEDCLCYK